MARLASMMSAFDAAWSLLKARDDRLVHGRMTAPPPIVGMMERLRNPKDEEGNPLPSMLGEAGDVRDQQVPLSEANMPRSVLQDEKRPPMRALRPVDVPPGQGDVVPVNIQQVERSVAPLREDVEAMMGGGSHVDPATGQIVDLRPGAMPVMPTATRKIPGYETMPEEGYHTRPEQRLARDQTGNMLGRTMAGQMGERAQTRGGSGAGIHSPMGRLRRRPAPLGSVEGVIGEGARHSTIYPRGKPGQDPGPRGTRSLAFGTGDAGRAMEAHRAAQEASRSPTESAMDALRALQGMPGVTIDDSGVEPAEEFRPSQLSTTSGMESGSSNLSSLGRRRGEMDARARAAMGFQPGEKERFMGVQEQMDPMTMALLQGNADPRVAAARTAEMDRRRALLDDADAMGRGQGEQRSMQARLDRS